MVKERGAAGTVFTKSTNHDKGKLSVYNLPDEGVSGELYYAQKKYHGMSRIKSIAEQSKADLDYSVLTLAVVGHLGDTTDLPNFLKEFPNCKKKKRKKERKGRKKKRNKYLRNCFRTFCSPVVNNRFTASSLIETPISDDAIY